MQGNRTPLDTVILWSTYIFLIAKATFLEHPTFGVILETSYGPEAEGNGRDPP